MKLREKFNVISCKDCAMPYCDVKCTMLSNRELDKLEQIADDYAIEFADWLNTLEAKYLIGDLILIRELNKNPKTEELLEIYKKEKGL